MNCPKCGSCRTEKFDNNNKDIAKVASVGLTAASVILLATGAGSFLAFMLSMGCLGASPLVGVAGSVNTKCLSCNHEWCE